MAKRCKSLFRTASGAIVRCVLDEGHFERAREGRATGTEDWACHVDRAPIEEDTLIAPGTEVWWEFNELTEADCTCPLEADTSIREDQRVALAEADPRLVAAVLASLLVGRSVRAERPYDEGERLVFAPAGDTYGAHLQVVDVSVGRDGAVVLHGDDGVELRLDRPEAFTWTVGSAEDLHPLLSMKAPPLDEEAVPRLGVLPDSHVLLPAHVTQAEVRRVESIQLPRRGDQVDRWLTERATSEGESLVYSPEATALLDGLVAEYRRHADAGVELGDALPGQQKAPAAPPSQPGRPSPASPAPAPTTEPPSGDA